MVEKVKKEPAILQEHPMSSLKLGEIRKATCQNLL